MGTWLRGEGWGRVEAMEKNEVGGRWEGQDFVLDEPIQINGREAEKITLPLDVELPPGVSRDDVICAMLHQVDPRDEEDGMRSVALWPGQADLPDEVIEELAAEAEAGYDVDRLTPCHHLLPCGCLDNLAGAHRVSCPEYPEGISGR